MNGIPPQMRTLIEAAIADGLGMDDIEQALIEPAHLPPEEHDAVWLYAVARRSHPHPRSIEIIAG
jgi:hypothetical protein